MTTTTAGNCETCGHWDGALDTGLCSTCIDRYLPFQCEASRMNDQKFCQRCGVVWDIDDDDPPKCKTASEVQKQINTRGMALVREVIS